MSEQKKGTFARVVGFVDDWQVGSYTLHKEYPVVDDDGTVFSIIDDDGDQVGCAWLLDVDCHFEKVVRA